MGHLGQVNCTSEQQTQSAQACLIDSCSMWNASAACWSFDGCDWDYRGCCKVWDSCSKDYVG